MPRPRKSLSDAVMQRFVDDPESLQIHPSQTTLPIEAIKVPERQPRRYFDPKKLEQLTNSVKEQGILEPLLVRPLKDGSYELVAGERRLRAAQEAGLTQVPIVSKALSDQEALQAALVENLQRDDLNPIDETEAILELLAIALKTDPNGVRSIIYQAANAKNRGVTLKKNVSLQISKIESYLANLGRFTLESFRSSRLPLLSLPPKVLETLREGKLEYSKARAIARLKDEEKQGQLLEETIAQNLPLSEIRSRVKESQPASEETPEQVLVKQMGEIAKRLRSPEAWGDRRKRNRITKLLNELDQLTGEVEE